MRFGPSWDLFRFGQLVVQDTTAQGKTHTLHKRSQNLTTSLQQRMSHDNLQKLLQPRAPPLNHIVAKSIGKHFSRQRGDGHARTLPLQYVAEVFEIRVSAADAALAQLEGGDVGAAEDLVVRVHGPADAVGSGVANLEAAKGLGLVTAQSGRDRGGRERPGGHGKIVPLSPGNSRAGRKSRRSSAGGYPAWPA